VPLIKASGYEADDVLATLAKQAAKAGLDVRMCSRDKDVDQMISERILVWDTFEDSVIGRKNCSPTKGLAPQHVDRLPVHWWATARTTSLASRASVKRQRSKLLAEHQTLDNVIANLR